MTRRFTAPENFNLWPQAKLHTQWPGKGVPGDPVFDRFFASQVEDIRDANAIEKLNRDAGAALLDRIGPAIVMTHSQSGTFGWGLANDRPKLVKGVISIEPSGPPFREIEFQGAPDWFKDGPFTRPYGIARGPLVYSPALSDPRELNMTQQAAPVAPGLVRCWLQGGTPRQLANLQGVPVLIVVSEASYHTSYDHCTSLYLDQAGVKHDFVRLPEAGIRGNAHMMMLEKNSDEIAALLVNWAQRNIR
jgi:pimeloyl-ACP methyl ester carboxylesterase